MITLISSGSRKIYVGMLYTYIFAKSHESYNNFPYVFLELTDKWNIRCSLISPLKIT